MRGNCSEVNGVFTITVNGQPYQTDRNIPLMYVLYALINAKGVFNQMNTLMGAPTVDYYAKKEYWPWFFTVSNMWKYAGYGSIIYLATLSGFDQELYEAAAIDGAGKWKQIRYIMIPQLIPTIVLLQILAIGRIFNGDFEMFYSLPNGSGTISDVTWTIDVYVYNMRYGKWRDLQIIQKKAFTGGDDHPVAIGQLAQSAAHAFPGARCRVYRDAELAAHDSNALHVVAVLMGD